jgi:agmatinase
MTSTDLLWACRMVAARAVLVGADVVEVLPTQIGAADITALVGSRLAHEVLTGLGMRRRALRDSAARPTPDPLSVG